MNNQKLSKFSATLAISIPAYTLLPAYKKGLGLKIRLIFLLIRLFYVDKKRRFNTTTVINLPSSGCSLQEYLLNNVSISTPKTKSHPFMVGSEQHQAAGDVQCPSCHASVHLLDPGASPRIFE